MPLSRMVTLFAAVQLLSIGAPNNKSVVKIAGSVGHKLVLFADGTVGGWGDTRDGQLGPRAGLAIHSNGRSTTGFVTIALPRDAGRAVDIAGGSRTTYVVFESGAVFAFGGGSLGELGCGEPCLKGSETPVRVEGLTDITQISAQSDMVLALHRDGSVSGWGGRVNRPQRIAGLSGIAEVAVGQGFFLARTADDRVIGWGKMPFGAVYTDDPVQDPTEVEGLRDVVQIAATRIGAALKKDGTVWVWGKNDQAQFGNGKRDDNDKTRIPVRVSGVANVTAISGGDAGRHFVALLKDGTIRAWGNSDWGQVGSGVTGRAVSTPVAVRITGTVNAVFAVGNHSFARTSDGNLWIWGLGSPYSGEWALTKNTAMPVRLNLP